MQVYRKVLKKMIIKYLNYKKKKKPENMRGCVCSGLLFIITSSIILN
jgi:hypothetical protein